MTWISCGMGVMGRVFTGIRAPSTLGTFLRTFTFGHVRVLDAVAADFLVNLIGAAPALRDAAVVTYLDIDDTVKATHGYTRRGAGYGYSGIKGLNALIATVSTPISAPLIAATRLRKGSANSARGAARLIGDALVTTKRCGATRLVIVRADSAYYNHDVVAAAARGEGLHHRPDEPGCGPGDLDHHRLGVDPDPVPEPSTARLGAPPDAPRSALVRHRLGIGLRTPHVTVLQPVVPSAWSGTAMRRYSAW